MSPAEEHFMQQAILVRQHIDAALTEGINAFGEPARRMVVEAGLMLSHPAQRALKVVSG